MKKDLLKFLFFAVAVMLVPYALEGGYLMNVTVFVGIHTILAVALNLLLGYAGQISLGQRFLWSVVTSRLRPYVGINGCVVGLCAID